MPSVFGDELVPFNGRRQRPDRFHQDDTRHQQRTGHAAKRGQQPVDPLVLHRVIVEPKAQEDGKRRRGTTPSSAPELRVRSHVLVVSSHFVDLARKTPQHTSHAEHAARRCDRLSAAPRSGMNVAGFAGVTHRPPRFTWARCRKPPACHITRPANMESSPQWPVLVTHVRRRVTLEQSLGMSDDCTDGARNWSAETLFERACGPNSVSRACPDQVRAPSPPAACACLDRRLR